MDTHEFQHAPTEEEAVARTQSGDEAFFDGADAPALDWKSVV